MTYKESFLRFNFSKSGCATYYANILR